MGDDNASHEGVADIDGATTPLAICSQLRGMIGSKHIKNRDAVGQIDVHKFIETLMQ